MPYLGRTPSAVPVTADDIPANSIDASKIIDGSIELAEISDGAITSTKLATAVNADIATGVAKVTNYNQTKADIEALGIAASSITGALPAISGASLTGLTSSQMPAGSVIQVVGTSNDVHVSTTAVSWVATSTTVTITPSSASNKIKIAHFSNGITNGSGKSGGIRLLRNGVQVMANTRVSYTPVDATHYYGINWSFVFLDSPSSTSAVVYTVEFGGEGQNIRYGDADVQVGTAQNRNNIIATEIKG